MADIYSICLNYDPGMIDFMDFPISEVPVWINGQKFVTQNPEGFERLKKTITSKLWFTYRKNFPPIGDTTVTSDAGWGCMLRCGQMVLAEALTRHYLGKDWRWEKSNADDMNPMYWHVLRMFQDVPTAKFSIHQIALAGGELFEKSVGSWFGPNMVAQTLRHLIKEGDQCALNIIVAMDSHVVLSDIRQQCRKKEAIIEGSPNTKSSWKPLLLVIPLRLGLDYFTSIYNTAVLNMFSMHHSIGMLGGRPNHAFYFIGSMGNELIFLDPHTTQQAVELDDLDDSSYHCNRAGRMDITTIDPSLAFCFYIETESDLEEWCKEARKVFVDHEQRSFFEILNEKPAHNPNDILIEVPDSLLHEGHSFDDEDDLDEDEDSSFEILG